MELDKRQPADGGEGCLVGVIRVPVKIVALIVVLPVRVVWDLLVAFGQAVRRHVLGPFSVYVLQPLLRGIGLVLTVLLKLVFVWPWVGLWRYLVQPVHAYLLAPVGRFVYAYLLRPLGEALAWAGRGGMRYLLAPLAKGVMWTLWALCMSLFVWPWVGLWRYVLAPVGRGLAWVGGLLHRYVLTPLGQALAWTAAFVHRYLLRPVGLGLWRYVLAPLGQALVWAWHVAGRIVRAVWRGVRLVGWVLVGWPAAQVYRHVLTPVGHVVRDVWRTVRTTVREVRAEVRKVLFGGPGREPARSRARTLGSTTAVSNPPAPERSLHKQG
ncbi:hypothetical protein ADK52_07720 [Streptomyces sp. WM6372]|uniref:hypothetical protein n=1 Tax=Streptomyces sp. WM6372 TaxID=1415555 RepID=UPI0006ADA257|nr:hypothetical protein [Streptomyces sp. WM6372]KOU28064.1 hypothetical protein ADK52_07720 [Streptomyces sp. WM6372]